MQPIYLDHNATTPLLPQAWEVMRDVPPGNPSSAHAAGRAARRALEDARERIAALLGAQPDEVTFTSGATEANNLAIFGHRPAFAIASHIEHSCVIEPLKQFEARGVVVEWLPVDMRGVLDSRSLTPRVTSESPTLVCLMLANHETGAVQPVREVAAALPPSAKLHCDAAQAVGKIPVHFRELGATTLSASAHKFGGPKGVGVLLTKRGTDLKPLTFGGHQQQGRRPGTEPVALAVGMAVALEVAVRNMDANRAKLEAFRERFRLNLQRDCPPVVLNGPEIGAADVAPTTLNVSFPGCRADLLLMALDLAGVACSTGSACSSGSLLPSPVLRAMGVPDEVLRSALRFSFSATQTAEEIDEAARRIAECVSRLRTSGPDPHSGV
jgi:cysteine desulfurase